MLEVEDPDTHIADRLSGQTPFMTNEPFVDLSTDEPPTEPCRSRPGAAERLPVSDRPRCGSDGLPAVGRPRPGRRQSGGAAPVEEIDLTSALGNLDNIAQTASEPSEDLEQAFEEIRAGAEDEDAEFAAQYLKLASTYTRHGYAR